MNDFILNPNQLIQKYAVIGTVRYLTVGLYAFSSV